LTVALTLPSGKSRRDRPVTCCIAGDVAREFVAYYREGDIVAVTVFTNRDR
jgi:hypothetical protein